MDLKSEICLLRSHESLMILELPYRGVPFSEYCPDTTRSIEEISMLFITLGEFIQIMHRAGVVHGDIKDSNVGVCNYVAKCFDMGLSVTIEPANVYTHTHNVLGGTWPYMAPEMVYKDQLCGYSDMWSAGILFLSMMLTEAHATEFKQAIQTFLKISKEIKGEGSYEEYVEKQEEFNILVKRLSQFEKLCPKLEESSQRFIDLIIDNLLQIDYTRRKTAEGWLQIVKAECSTLDCRHMYARLDVNAFQFSLNRVTNKAGQTFLLHSRLTQDTLVVLLLPTRTNTKCKHVDEKLDQLRDVAENVKVFWCQPKDVKVKYYPENAVFIQETEKTSFRSILGIASTNEAAVVLQGKKVCTVTSKQKHIFFNQLINEMKVIKEKVTEPLNKKRKVI
jgi:serine/threonine protein kinase